MKRTYDEVSPITNNLCVIVDTDDVLNTTSKLCMESGYTTNTFLKNEEKIMDVLKSRIPRIAFDFKIVDRFNQVWIPTMKSTEKAAIYPTPDETDNESFKWQVTPIKDLPEEEYIKYPNPEVPGEFLTKVADFQNSVDFERGDFENAYEYFVKVSYDD
jgi:hypothetical protein